MLVGFDVIVRKWTSMDYVQYYRLLIISLLLLIITLNPLTYSCKGPPKNTWVYEYCYMYYTLKINCLKWNKNAKRLSSSLRKQSHCFVLDNGTVSHKTVGPWLMKQLGICGCQFWRSPQLLLLLLRQFIFSVYAWGAAKFTSGLDPCLHETNWKKKTTPKTILKRLRRGKKFSPAPGQIINGRPLMGYWCPVLPRFLFY